MLDDDLTWWHHQDQMMQEQEEQERIAACDRALAELNAIIEDELTKIYRSLP